MEFFGSISAKEIVRIESEAYPYDYRGMEGLCTFEEIAEYYDCSPKKFIIFGEEGSWYALVSKQGKSCYFEDIAKIPGGKRIDWAYIVQVLRELGIKKVGAEMREATSYPIILKAQELLGIKIVKDKRVLNHDVGEWVHEVVIKLN